MATIGISLGALALAGLYHFQTSIIYPANLGDSRTNCPTPDQYEMPYELVNLKTEDGETLQCYLLKHDSKSSNYSNKTVLILCPNAGNIGFALPIVALFYRQFKYNVFIYSYRGYGKSTGKPSEIGLKIDADRVMKYLCEEDEQFSKSSLILYGRSLGSAVGIYIASKMPSAVDAIILENAFLSIKKTIPHIFPFLKYFTMFVHQHWELEKLVPKIPANIPVLLLSARQDEIVPPEHMDVIFDLLNSDVKQMYKFEDSSHNDTVAQERYWEYIHEFIKENVNPIGL